MRDKILVVEDSQSFASLLVSTLSQQTGFDVDLATSYAEAKECLEQNKDRYFVATVDLNLPDANDGEAVDLTLAASLPTVVFTSTGDQNTQKNLWSKGIADYILKSGIYSVHYAAWVVNRIYANPGVKVLIVNESNASTQAMRAILALQKFTLLSASSGAEALAILAEHPDIKVCILESELGHMDGCQVATKMRETHRREELDIIGVTSFGSSLSARFIKSGANDVLFRPFATEELLCRVNHGVEFKEAYLQLKELNTKKNQVLGTAAHDIRGPIATIKTASEFLIKKELAPERKSHLLNMIHNNSMELLELLESLLDVSAIESGQVNLTLESTNLSELVEDRLAIYGNQADNKSIKLTVDVEPNIIRDVDRVKFKQVVDNLITNAIKYSPKESEVDIKVFEEQGMFHLAVSDSGPGIIKEEQSHLFKPFAVLSSSATAGEKKTGLGLAIAKNIVDAHNGTISYADASNGGACFSVRL